MAGGAGKLGCLPRQGSGARKCSGPGDELDPDQQRSIGLNARIFQKTLIGKAQSKGPDATSPGGVRFPKATSH